MSSGEARRREGDPCFALGRDAASGSRGGPSQLDKAAVFIVPGAVLPTSTDDEDDNFQVAFSFRIWCYDTDSQCGFCRISELCRCDHGRGGAVQGVANSS